jgi:hypothetical protein
VAAPVQVCGTTDASTSATLAVEQDAAASPAAAQSRTTPAQMWGE